MIDKEITDKVAIFNENINSFAIIDYFTNRGLDTAMGILISVSPEGDMFVQHKDRPEISWGFNIHQIKNYKFSKPEERR